MNGRENKVDHTELNLVVATKIPLKKNTERLKNNYTDFYISNNTVVS